MHPDSFHMSSVPPALLCRLTVTDRFFMCSAMISFFFFSVKGFKRELDVPEMKCAAEAILNVCDGKAHSATGDFNELKL